MHYHTTENTPGYLPDADFAPTFETEAEAVADANGNARDYAESIADEAFEAGVFEAVKVTLTGEGTGWVLVTRSDRMHDLGRVFAVEGCVEAHPEA